MKVYEGAGMCWPYCILTREQFNRIQRQNKLEAGLGLKTLAHAPNSE